MISVTIKPMENTLHANVYYVGRWIGLISTSDAPIPKREFLELMKGNSVKADLVFKTEVK